MRKIGEIIGYLFMYFLFTTILYFILNFLDKIPKTWNYFHIIILTGVIVLLGNVIREILK